MFMEEHFMCEHFDVFYGCVHLFNKKAATLSKTGRGYGVRMKKLALRFGA